MPLHSQLLKYIKEVGKCDSIRLAAKNLYVSSSAINRRIIELENELEIKLFERTTAGVSPTQAGNILIAHITRTLEDAEITLSEINKLKSQTGGEIRLAGAFSTQTIFVELLDDYYSKFPDSFLSYSAVANNIALDLISSKRAELAVIFDSKLPNKLRALEVISVPLGVLMNPAHPLALNKNISFHDCCNYPLILPDSTWPVRDRLNEIFATGGHTPQIVSSSNTPDIMKSVIKTHEWLGFLSKVGMEEELNNNELVCAPLTLDDGEVLCVDLSIAIHEEQDITEHLSFIIEWLSIRLQDYSF